jgi:hypothetical protein
MVTSFKIEHSNDGKIIKLSAPLSNRVKILDLFYALMFLAATIIFGYMFVTQWSLSISATIISGLAVFAFAIAFYRFFNKATETEKLFVKKNRLEIVNAGFLKMKRKSFIVNEISDLKFNEKEKFEPHPLKGETFDYLGFQTDQQVIQDLHSEGRVSFNYRGSLHRFGKELASWEFNELEDLIYELTGNDLSQPKKF